MQDPEWGAEFQTVDNDEFLAAMYGSRQCALFVDESGSAIGRYSGAMQVVATRSRHFGHKAHFITQRPSQLDKLVRDQCSQAFIFCVSKGDAKMLAEEFNDDLILTAPQLPRGECFKVGRYERATRHNIFQPITQET